MAIDGHHVPWHAGAPERVKAAQGHRDCRVEVGTTHPAQRLDGDEEHGPDGKASEDGIAHQDVAFHGEDEEKVPRNSAKHLARNVASAAMTIQ